MNSRHQRGRLAKIQSRRVEDIFKRDCAVEFITCIQIADGEIINKKTFKRKKQLCDFIIFIDQKAIFCDVKTIEKDKLAKSVLFAPPTSLSKKTSSQRQCEDFLRLLQTEGYIYSCFVLYSKQNNLFYILSTSSIANADLNLVKLEKIRDIKVYYR